MYLTLEKKVSKELLYILKQLIDVLLTSFTKYHKIQPSTHPGLRPAKFPKESLAWVIGLAHGSCSVRSSQCCGGFYIHHKKIPILIEQRDQFVANWFSFKIVAEGVKKVAISNKNLQVSKNSFIKNATIFHILIYTYFLCFYYKQLCVIMQIIYGTNITVMAISISCKLNQRHLFHLLATWNTF